MPTDIQDLIAKSVFHNEIAHHGCDRKEAESLLAIAQANEDHEGDVDANGTIEIWGTYHCAQGQQPWRVRLDIQGESNR